MHNHDIYEKFVKNICRAVINSHRKRVISNQWSYMTHLLQLLDLILPNPLNLIAAGQKTSSFSGLKSADGVRRRRNDELAKSICDGSGVGI